MTILFPSKNNYPASLLILYSVFFHITLFLILYFFHFSPTVLNEKQNIVYLELTPIPKSETKTFQEPAPQVKSIEPMKNQPKKKLIQKKTISAKSAPLVDSEEEFPTPPKQNAKNIPSQSQAQPSFVNPSSQTAAVPEAVVDTVARCPMIDIALTSDAANAGVSAGRLLFEVTISDSGKVLFVKTLKGTGFTVDEKAIDAIKKLVCVPAEKGGKKVAVKKLYQVTIDPTS